MSPDDLTIDAALLERVKARLPDDPAKDSADQADDRKLLQLACMVGLLGGQALQALKGAEECLTALTKPLGDLANVEQP